MFFYKNGFKSKNFYTLLYMIIVKKILMHRTASSYTELFSDDNCIYTPEKQHIISI